MKLFLFVFVLHLTFLVNAQKVRQERLLDSVELSHGIDEFRWKHGQNKHFPRSFELAILVALSYLPALDSTYIIIKMSNIGTSLNARPKFGSGLFRRKHKRRYVIRIHPPAADSTVTLDQASFNAQVGVFGHELNHLIDYSQRSFFGILGRAFSYLTKKTKEKYEKEIDQMTINCGLGWQLHDWSAFVVNDSVGTMKYKKFKREIYLEPKEIIETMKSE